MFKTHASAELLFKEAENLGLRPQWETPYGLFSFQKDKKKYYLFYTMLHLNSQLGAWMAQDKNITHTMLKKNDFPDIPFCYTTQIKDVNRFFDTRNPIIQKPVLGMKAEDTYLIKSRDEIRKDSLDKWIFEQYIPGVEYRCFVLKGNVIAMQEKRLAPTEKYPWKKIFHNLEEKEWKGDMVVMSVAISKLFHMGCVAVDFILDESHKTWVLEVNGMPGLYSFHHPDEGESINLAKKILQAVFPE